MMGLNKLNYLSLYNTKKQKPSYFVFDCQKQIVTFALMFVYYEKYVRFSNNWPSSLPLSICEVALWLK